ncbi:hypothetical protein ARMGADRAFT_28569 [Armillaria gallica]|uniref:Uncharacterized protein n=1 Tax=Armillaria gallica TaxID=47427 RepID=A0A2H3E8E7_ARMGA|nr:hypothetical protein ARMGADRAFT_28569 [Armillaria gallica]
MAGVGPVLDNFTVDSVLGSITHDAQHIQNDISSARSTNQVHHKAQGHAHNTASPQTHFTKEMCPFIRDIRAGHRVPRRPVAFTLDMQLFMVTSEYPDFCVYATSLDSEMKLYVAYALDLTQYVRFFLDLYRRFTLFSIKSVRVDCRGF